jgi:hypothetical protein
MATTSTLVLTTSALGADDDDEHDTELTTFSCGGTLSVTTRMHDA